jgi:hypothetical protein
MGFLDKLLGQKKEFKSDHLRNGSLVESDERHKASISCDCSQMLKQLYKKGDPIDTHFLYLHLVDNAYSRRKEPEMRALFKKLALEHVVKFDIIRGPLLKDMGMLPHVPTFQYLATVYTEDGEYDKAIEVCEKAIAFDLHDWTKGDYQARIERIKKKM